MSPLVPFFLPFMIIIRSVGLLLWRYWNISKTGMFVSQFMHHAVALSWKSDFTWLSRFVSWMIKKPRRRCRRPAPLKCCIYYKVEPVLVLGKPRPTKGRPARAPLRSDKGKNSVRGWRRPRSAALYALFHHRFFSFHNEKISKVFDHQKKLEHAQKPNRFIKKAFSEILVKKEKKTRSGNC